MLQRAFKRWEKALPVRFFDNGSALVEHARSERIWPKILLLDLQMPIMGGLEALKALGAHPGSHWSQFSSFPHRRIPI